MKVLDLFAGIGGFTLGLERAGFETAAFCEIDPYAQKVLKKNWPGVPLYDDVRSITAERLISDGIRVDVITGGFPCQDISTAGRQAGIEGERSGLWSECARLIGEIRPRYAIFENVTNLLNGERGAWFKRVLWDISKVGYDAEWHCIPASAIGAHHHRDRIWIICYPNSDGHFEMLKQEDGSRDSQRQKEKITKSKGTSDTEVLPYPKSIGSHRASNGSSEKVKRQDGEQAQQSSEHGEIQPLAYASSKRLQGSAKESLLRKRYLQKQFERSCQGQSGIWAIEPEVGRVANGIPSRSHRLKCLGNAVVPQIPELIGRAIIDHEKATG